MTEHPMADWGLYYGLANEEEPSCLTKCRMGRISEATAHGTQECHNELLWTIISSSRETASPYRVQQKTEGTGEWALEQMKWLGDRLATP